MIECWPDIWKSLGSMLRTGKIQNSEVSAGQVSPASSLLWDWAEILFLNCCCLKCEGSGSGMIVMVAPERRLYMEVSF